MPYVAPPGFRTVRVVPIRNADDADTYAERGWADSAGNTTDVFPPIGSTVAVSVATTPDAERSAKRGRPMYAQRVAWLAADGSETRAFVQTHTWQGGPLPVPAPVAAKRRWPWVVAGLAVVAWLAS